MALFGFRKRRPSRVIPLKPASSFWRAFTQPLANRAVWLRVGMCALALTALVICLEAWRPPFPYRIGDFADHGIVARVDFRRIDWFKTDRARSDAEAQTPHVFRNDPKPLTLLPAKLQANLREIAEAKSLGDVVADDARRLRTDAGQPGRAGQPQGASSQRRLFGAAPHRDRQGGRAR